MDNTRNTDDLKKYIDMPRLAYKFDTYGLEIKALRESAIESEDWAIVFYVAGAWTPDKQAYIAPIKKDGDRFYFCHGEKRHYFDEFIQA